MTMLPCSRWPLAEHIAFGQNTFDVSIGSVVSLCIGTSCRWIPIFSSPPHFHRLVGLYHITCSLRTIPWEPITARSSSRYPREQCPERPLSLPPAWPKVVRPAYLTSQAQAREPHLAATI